MLINHLCNNKMSSEILLLHKWLSFLFQLKRLIKIPVNSYIWSYLCQGIKPGPGTEDIFRIVQDCPGQQPQLLHLHQCLHCSWSLAGDPHTGSSPCLYHVWKMAKQKQKEWFDLI